MSRACMTVSRPGVLLDDIPGLVHGIKRGRPPYMVQCDDCLTCFSGEMLIFVAHAAFFNPHVPGVRLCDPCWGARGWYKEHHGWRHRGET